MKTKKLKARLERIETDARVRQHAVNQLNRRVDRLIELITDHEVTLNGMRDKRDKCEA